MKKDLLLLFFFFLLLLGCVPKSEFDDGHSPGFNAPWSFTLKKDSFTVTSATISWTKSQNSTRYEVYYKLSSDSSYNLASSNATSPYQVSGLTTGQTYQFKVVAIGEMENTVSNIISIFTSTAPTVSNQVLTNVTAGTSRTITISYTDTDSDLATSCQVLNPSGLTLSSCSCNSSGVCTVTATGNSSFIGGAEFDYRVTANDQVSNTANISFDYECPTRYVPVLANSTLGSSSFCIMQFEAKNVSGVPTSQPASMPWTNITISAAKTACQNIGSKYDLTSNLEWMALVRGMETVASNWTGGSSGNGMLYAGNSDNSYGSNNLLAISNESDEYDGTGNNSSELPGSGKEQKRKLTTYNGENIWDITGNASEWVDWSTNSGLQSVTTSQKAYKASDGAPINSAIELNTLDTLISASDEMKPNNWQPANTSYTSNERIGTYTAGLNSTGGYARRGGNFSSSADSGLYQLDLTKTNSDSNIETGFRCVYRP